VLFGINDWFGARLSVDKRDRVLEDDDDPAEYIKKD
jgi:hypothetical protein